MKSERRHELQTNALADWIGRQVEAVRPYVNLTLTAVVLAVAALVGWMYYRAQTASQTTAAWADFYRAASEADPQGLMEMAQRHPAEPASQWALLLAADMQLAQGSQNAFEDRPEAERMLKQAAERYQAVLQNAREPLLRRRAAFGLAETHESLYAVTADEEHLNAAIQNYQAVAEEWPDAVLAKTAQRKAELLSDQSAQEFLTWFARQEPPEDRTPSGAGGFSPGGAFPSPGGAPPKKEDDIFDPAALPGADELSLPDDEGPGLEGLFPESDAGQKELFDESPAGSPASPDAQDAGSLESAPPIEEPESGDTN